MIFYKKPKIYKNGRVRHGVVIIDGVKYTAEFVKPKMHEQDSILDLNYYDPTAFEWLYKMFGYLLIRYNNFTLKLTKIE